MKDGSCMKNGFAHLLAFVLLMVQTPLCLSKDVLNVVLLPDPFKCHQLGVDFAITENSTLGIIGAKECKSDRPTYGSSNSNVDNTFSRILIPWRYSTEGAFNDGYFMQAVFGAEKSEFRSDAGSTADVTFADIGFYGGYQWFWSNGFNVSALVGVAFLAKRSLDKNIVPSESGDVVEFLDKNTRTNAHPGIGIILGWSF
jgi:hypothetical protein